MKVLAFNSSLWMDKGTTALLLAPFLEGMREEGAEIELFYTSKLDINPCQGDFNCLKTSGECSQVDDMQMLLPKLREADIWVFTTPVYWDGIASPLKNLMERMLPLWQPFFELKDGHSRHPLREGVKRGRVVLVSSCGLWEMDNFDPLLAHMRAFCRNADREFAGALLRPHGPQLRLIAEMGRAAGDVSEAAKEAGRQLLRDGQMSAETLDVVSRELIPLEVYLQVNNKGIQYVLDRLKEK